MALEKRARRFRRFLARALSARVDRGGPAEAAHGARSARRVPPRPPAGVRTTGARRPAARQRLPRHRRGHCNELSSPSARACRIGRRSPHGQHQRQLGRAQARSTLSGLQPRRRSLPEKYLLIGAGAHLAPLWPRLTTWTGRGTRCCTPCWVRTGRCRRRPLLRRWAFQVRCPVNASFAAAAAARRATRLVADAARTRRRAHAQRRGRPQR